jgi:halimadienyl-diphosphate synthase
VLTDDLVDHLDRLLPEPAVTPISPSAYDTAAVATLRGTPGGRDLLLPSAADWLLANQHADGSWGSPVPTPHDRVVNTLAAVVALAELAGSGPDGFPDVTRRIADGVERLHKMSGEVRPGDPRETIGFEFVVPALLQRARGLGLPLPFSGLGWVRDLYERKMSVVPADAFHRVTTLAHSLETFADRWPRSALAGLQARDGSFGCSPAATAAMYDVSRSDPALRYLTTALRATGQGAAPTVFPFRTFDDGWTFHPLAMAGVAPRVLHPHVKRLAGRASPRGFGPSDGLPPDADDTGMVLPLLAYCGYPADLSLLRGFETPEGYLTFELERGFSVSTNVHVLGALLLDPTGMARQIDLVLRFLRDSLSGDGYWLDKWHLSPYYATCHAIPVLSGLDDRLCGDAVGWVLGSQHADGSWGLAGGTLEETGYAVNSLLAVQAAYPWVRDAAHRGARYLSDRCADGEPAHPPLWIGKVLYTPYRVVQAAVVGALYHYARMPWSVAAASATSTLRSSRVPVP